MADAERAVRHARRDHGDRRRALRTGQLVVRVTEQPQRLAAQQRGRDRARLTSHGTQVDQPATGPQHPRRRGGGDPEHRVQHQVGRPVDGGGEPGRQFIHIGRVERDHRVRTGRHGSCPARRRSRRRHDPPRTGGLREPDRGLTDHPARAEHDHLLAMGQLTAPRQRHVRGHRRQPERRHEHGVGVIRQRHQFGLGHRDHRRHRPVAGPHARTGGEPHRAPADRADTLDAGYVRRRGHPEVRRARRAQQVERGDRRGRHLDQHLVRARRGRGPLDERGRFAGGVQRERPAHVAMSG